MVVIKYPKSSGDDLLLQTSFSDHGDHIFFEKKNDENVAILDRQKTEGVRKRYDYIWNRIESAKIF